MNANLNRGIIWSETEHELFLQAIQIYPHGPWRYVAQHVGTRDVRQVQTHAQKYYEKISRHLRGLRKERRSTTHAEHRIDDLTVGLQTPDDNDDKPIIVFGEDTEDIDNLLDFGDY